MGRSKKKGSVFKTFTDWYGDEVTLSKPVYTKHILRRHPDFFGNLGELEGALAAPDEVIKKNHDSDVWWVNKRVKHHGEEKCLRICIAKERGQRTIRTAHLTDSPKRGVTVWRQKSRSGKKSTNTNTTK